MPSIPANTLKPRNHQVTYSVRGWGILVLCAILMGSSVSPAFAQSAKGANAAKKDQRPAAGVATYNSKNFVVHTDLPATEAKDLLSRLESMLVLVEQYFERKLGAAIEMYVVKDLEKWPAGSLDPEGRQSIEGGGGVTLGQTIQRRDLLTAQSQIIASKAVVYAVAERGTPQHEAVHAYCVLTFGRTGPTWYSEGMAELGQYWREKERGVNCHEVVLRYLKSEKPKELAELVDVGDRSGDSWQNYAWRWALCHILANNPNYAPRFKPLGLGLLTGQDVSFERVYGPMAKEINFEYHFFLAHLEENLRADLIAWDWKAKFTKLRGTTTTSAKVDAARGWQPSRATVSDQEEYEYSATGSWKTSPTATAVTADGDDSSQGKLQAIIFDDYKLSEPFELGTYGTFTPPTSGDLYVRCGDQWNELVDNSGKISLKIKLKGKGNPLPKPESSKTTTEGATTRKSPASSSSKKKPTVDESDN